jgi:hypothetical protein
MQFKPGTEVRVKQAGDDPYIEMWSSYCGYFGTVINTIDDQYALVYLPEKLSNGKNPLARVPWCQLDEVPQDKANSKDEFTKNAEKYEPLMQRAMQLPVSRIVASELNQSTLSELFSFFENQRKPVTHLFMNTTTYKFLAPVEGSLDGYVGTLWGAAVVISDRFQDNDITFIAGNEMTCMKIEKKA